MLPSVGSNPGVGLKMTEKQIKESYTFNYKKVKLNFGINLSVLIVLSAKYLKNKLDNMKEKLHKLIFKLLLVVSFNFSFVSEQSTVQCKSNIEVGEKKADLPL